MTATSDKPQDLVILGGGLVGMTLALAAAKKGLSSHVIDRADPAELTALVKSADTLDAFAQGITQMEQDIGAPMADFEAAEGSLPLPALGELLTARGRS